MLVQGIYTLKNPSKYRGDVTRVTYRSSWELRVMKILDDHPSINWWSSEELIIRYLSPVDGRMHRYFPDFVINVTTRSKQTRTLVIEVKPHAQCSLPKPPKRQTPRYINEVKTFAVNQAKWKAAETFCLDHGWTFKVMTEKDLKIT
mgnify:CR=1 FL=1